MKGGPDPSRTALLWLWAALLLGVAVRLLATRAPGFPTDVGTFVAWSERLAAVGPGAFYEPGYFSDYPPAFLYVLWVLGSFLEGGALLFAIKAISIPFDLAIALLLAAIVRRRAGAALGALAGGLWMLQPGPIFAGPYWGQADAIGTLPLLAAVLYAGRGRWGTAGVLAAVAAMIKPQFGVVAVPLAFAVLFHAWQARRPLDAVRFGGAGLITVAALALPFRLDPLGLYELLSRAAETYPYTSLYAFNPWSVIGGFWEPDDAFFRMGAFLLVVGIAASALPLWWRRDTAMLLAAVALASFAFYFLPTRAHERYLFPALVLLLPFAVTRSRVLVPYLVLAATFFVTLYFAFSRYPAVDLVAPQLLELTLFSRNGQIAIALLMTATAGLLVWRLVRGEATLVPTLRLPSWAAALSARSWRLPAALAPGRIPTKRDFALALLVALAVLATRGYRLDHPHDMYFDEVYHARTAFELLAQREPYEWTHPLLAKEIMALGILAFGGDRVVASEQGPGEATAFAVSSIGHRIYGFEDGTLRIEPVPGISGITHIRQLDGPVVGVGVESATNPFALTERSLYFDAIHAERPIELAEPPVAFAVSDARVVVAGPEALHVYTRLADPVRIPIRAVALAARDGSDQVFVAAPDGRIHVVDIAAGREVGRPISGGGPASAIAYADRAERIYTARAGGAAIDWYEAPKPEGEETSAGRHIGRVPLSNASTGQLSGGVSAMALVPRTQFLYAVVDGHAVAIETHGASPFAAIPVSGSLLGVDGAADRLLVLGDEGIESIETGQHAFAWRLPGVLFAAMLAFFAVLLARRLFASVAIAAFAGIALVLDGSMFAQARIGMNDVYVGALIVAGWYFVVAAHRPRRRAWMDLVLAGAAFGLALAAKWVAAYALLGVGAASLLVTALAWRRGDAGGGGPLDLLAGRGRQLLLLAASFGVLPLLIYLGTYLPWFGGPTVPFGWDLVDLTKQMYWYHSGLTAAHPAGSPWWSWPLVLKPVYWYLGNPGAGQTAVIYDAGNLVLFWGGIAAVGWAAVAAVRGRSAALGLLLLAMLAQYLAWIPITRVLFFYHFFTALPFYLLILAAGLGVLWERGRRVLVGGYIALAAAAFAFFYPFVSGQAVAADAAAMFFVLPTWQYDCQFYPAFTCPLSVPGSIPFAAIAAQLSIALLVGLFAAGLFALWMRRRSDLAQRA